MESLPACLSEIEALGQLSWAETVPQLEPGRRFGLDRQALLRMDELGVLKVLTARSEAGELLGYISWVLQFDLEDFGALIAEQGSWYVAPGSWGVAWKLFMASLEVLRELGVRHAYPHQRTIGRSAGLARFFERLGARPIKIVWSLDLQPQLQPTAVQKDLA